MPSLRMQAYHMDQQFDLAVQQFDSALQVYPRYYDALEQRALVHLDNGNVGSGITCLEQMLAIDREWPVTTLPPPLAAS